MRAIPPLGIFGALCLLGVSAPPAYADNLTGRFYMDFTTDFEYEEPGLMEQDGDLLGLGVDLLYPMGERGEFRLDVRYRLGQTDYTGATQAGERATTDADDEIWDIRFLTGLRINPTFTPYTGLGYRQWDQSLNDGTTASGGRALGYDRGHKYLYIPVGARLAHDQQAWHFHLGGEVQPVLRGEAYADLPFGRGRFDMNEGYGAYVYGGVSYDLTDAVSLSGELYFQYWDMDESDSDTIAGFEFIEPSNRTRETGIRLGVNW